MSHNYNLSASSWTFSELYHIDLLCDEFARAWSGESRLTIEQLLAQHADLPRAILLDRLLRLELHLSRLDNGLLTLDPYQERFSADSSVVMRAWHDFMTNGARPELAPTVANSPSCEASFELQENIGRFMIRRFLGRGSFGRVYLARDLKSGLDVALKVPHANVLVLERQLEDLRHEADTGSLLDHPNLVRTLGFEQVEGQLLIVQEFIDGQNLTDWYAANKPTPDQVVNLMIPVAQALDYLHLHHFVHRDLKPGNILVDINDKAYIADFGLALHEAQQREREHRGELAGTLAYMAPEQVRRQNQLVDGQADLWSFGVILYRLLTDRFPFGGPPPCKLAEQSDYIRDLEYEIAEHDPRPPRQINPKVARKLEQICLRCLEKRKRDRYPTGQDLADDLLQVLERSHNYPGRTSPEDQLRIVPKGLRSFDAADAPFFAELLPGPRTLEGIPVSLNFWRNRLSDLGGGDPIDVGVLYGPSGCGKSSFVKAGLIPILGDKFVPLFIESTPQDTEVRLLKALRNAIPNLPTDGSIVDACHWVSTQGAGSGRKILLVFDQFEQWLNSHTNPGEHQLVTALRLCNGTRLQTLLLVRDDFWMPLTRLMGQLEIPLQENNNTAAVDLFDCDHALKVLSGLGRAYGRLPNNNREHTAAQDQFISSSVEGLAEDRRITCVRLALFAEMMKDRPWTPEELENVGGAKGIGVAFLEEKFGPNAPAIYRPHRTAVRKILEALLPPFGSDIRGQMRSLSELLAASEAVSKTSFEQLIEILDTDLKLLTPVVPDHPSGHMETPTLAESQHYQLTHDYLVPSIREWLTRKQRESWQGRCRLCLEERSALWNSRPEPKQLPTAWETVQITMARRGGGWSNPQARMMLHAQRLHGRRLLSMGFLLFASVAAGWFWKVQVQSASLLRAVEVQVDGLLGAQISRVPLMLEELKPTFDLWKKRLVLEANQADSAPSERLRATMALLIKDRSYMAPLLDQIVSADPQVLSVTGGWLKEEIHPDSQEVWEMLGTQPPTAQLRFAALLAQIDPQPSERWTELSEEIVPILLSSEAANVLAWSELLLPVGPQLTNTLSEQFLTSPPNSDLRQTAALALSKLGSTAAVCRVLPDADVAQLSLFLRAIADDRATAVDLLRPLLSAAAPAIDLEARLKHVARQRTCCVALLRLGHGELVWPLLQAAEDSSLRTELILSLTSHGVSLETLFHGEETVRDPVARQAIWLAMAGPSGELPADQAPQIVERLSARWPHVTHLAERSAMQWLGERCGTPQGRELRKPQPGTRGADWFENSQGQTFAEFRGPVEFSMGSPSNEPRRDGNETRHRRKIDRNFAIAITEATVEQFGRFRADYSPDPQVGPSPQCPASTLSWLDAVKYCRWLSEQERFPESQMCYPPVERIHAEMTFPADMLERTSYRLPTESEWEYVCRAGTTSRYFFGEDERHATSFAWVLANSREITWPVGQLRPNPFGLFDIQGNLQEWCQDAFAEYPVDDNSVVMAVAEIEGLSNTDRVFRGAMFRSPYRPMRSAFRFRFPPSSSISIFGFRIARTIPP